MATSNKKQCETGNILSGQSRTKQQGVKLDDNQVEHLLSFWDSDKSLNQIAQLTGFSYYTCNKYFRKHFSKEDYKKRVKRMRSLHAYRHKDIELFNHPNWKGGIRLGNDGYLEVVKPDWMSGKHRYTHYHRMIYCLWNNGMNSLSSDIDVHHVDHNKMNNEPSNLIALTKSEHSRLHHAESVTTIM